MLTDFDNYFTVGNSNKLYAKQIQYFLPSLETSLHKFGLVCLLVRLSVRR